MFQQSVKSVCLGLGLVVLKGLIVIGCGDSNGPGRTGSTGLFVTIAASVSSSALPTPANGVSVIGTFVATNETGKGVYFGAARVKVSRLVKDLHITHNNVIVGVGTFQSDGTWLVTPPKGALPEAITDFGGPNGSSNLVVKANLTSNTTGVEVTTQIMTITLLNFGLTETFEVPQDKQVGFIRISSTTDTTPVNLPEAGPIPYPHNFTPPSNPGR